MRILTERTKGKKVETLDGIKVYESEGWVQVLPDPDEPVLHLYAEGGSEADTARLEEQFLSLVEEAVAGPDGELDNNDFIAFINRFFSGC